MPMHHKAFMLLNAIRNKHKGVFPSTPIISEWTALLTILQAI